MRFTSEQRLDDGVLEREFALGEIPGILWTPGSASAPSPLILLGHPGGLHKMYPRLVARARHSAAEGFAAATIELPGSGDRPRSAAAEEADRSTNSCSAVRLGQPSRATAHRGGHPDPAGRRSPARGAVTRTRSGYGPARPGWTPPGWTGCGACDV